MISLVNETIDKKDIDKLIEWLKQYPHLTKGELTVEYEKKWSEMLGCDYSVFVNSGSSANLLMLYVLIETGIIEIQDKVVVPAVAWSTDLAPVIQLGLNPILCDCNLEDLSVELNQLEHIFKTQKPKVLLLVSVLGLVPNMSAIVKLCERYDVILLEDACESLGSKFENKSLGTFGLMSSFSTFFGHHISTIEGGMVCTNDKKIYNMLKSLRSHGWDRDMDEEYQANLRSKYEVDDFSALYKFYNCGFNFRSTDLQAFLGINQLNKLPDIVFKRNKNYLIYQEYLDDNIWKPKQDKTKFVSSFAHPIIHSNRENIIKSLKEADVEFRPLICGSLAEQPVWKKKFADVPVNLPNATIVNDFGMYLPNNHKMVTQEIRLVCDIVNEIIK
jgi:CDP-6-deoxy-D-xylo-4-hexulose-3-dehydrase